MRHSGGADPIWVIPPFERTDHPPATQLIRSAGHKSGQAIDVAQLEGKLAEGIAAEGVEPGGDEDEIRRKPVEQLIERLFERIDVDLGRKTAGHWNVANGSVRARVRCRAGTGVPWPLMDREEPNIGIVLDQRLGAIAVMDIPIGN